MESDEISDQYFTYDGRLASFQAAQPVARRASNAKGKAPKSLAWPHEQLDPEQLSRAGFFFAPTPEYPDNTVCFLCTRRIGGWEESDNPFEEHLRLSPHCGWAIVAGIEVGLGDYGMDDPTSAQMIEARKATFGGRWPHEGKRAWKCKTKQLVDAGWKYTPTSESEDMATCTYCQLALDGWEPKDNPMDEHYRRSPDCQFFNLINHYRSIPGKKRGRAKGARTSKASRVSGQSIATVASDVTSLLDQPAELEDSVITTTSVMTQGGTKRGRAKKGTAAKGKKTRARKDEAVEVLEDPPEPQEDAHPPPKPTRGRKRASDSIEDSVLTAAEAPAPKKRAGRGRRSNTVDTSIIDQQPNADMTDEEPASLPKARGRGKAKTKSNTRNTRIVSAASTVSTTSVATEDEHMMDDDELDRQLQADMDRPLSDDESIAADSDSGRRSDPTRPKSNNAATSSSPKQEEPRSDHAMFDPAPPEVDETVVDTELKALEAEMETEAVEQLQVPKKGRKAGPRKASKQTKKAKEKAPVEPAPGPEPTPAIEAEAFDELADGHDISINSDGTVVRNSLSSTASAPRKRGRPSKKAMAAKALSTRAESVEVEPVANSSKIERIDFANHASEPILPSKGDLDFSAKESSPPPQDKFSPPPPDSDELGAPSTPKAAVSPAPSAKQATVSPSQSPQSSDAENRPPSSRPSNTTNSSRIALAPVAATPVHSSPSKRNVFAGLESSQPWSGVDLDMIFEDLDKENAASSAKFLKSGADLTSPEKRMTVEEWVYYNAEQAEKKLKHECEAMVTSFEKEGTRAMQTLEGLVVE